MVSIAPEQLTPAPPDGESPTKESSPPESAVTGSAIPAAILRNFQGQLSRMLAATPDDAGTAWRLAEVSRAAGDLEGAARAYRACLMLDPASRPARLRLCILEGTAAVTDQADDDDRPVPFLRFTRFLPPDRLAELWRVITDRQEELRPSRIARAQTKGLLVPEYRHSVAMTGRADAGPLILPAVMDIIRSNDLVRRFGTRPLCQNPAETEVEIAAHGDGGFFRIHRDAGAAHAGRAMTFVFYLFREPARFTGGDLLLHDEGAACGSPLAQKLTRVHPENNSLLIFPSDRWHQVLPVQGGTGDPLDGRLTVHGWIHAEQPSTVSIGSGGDYTVGTV